MKKPRFFSPGAKQVSASVLNTVVRNQREGDNIHVAGALKKTVLHGQVTIIPRRARAAAREPFEPWVLDIAARKVAVASGRFTLGEMIFPWSTIDTYDDITLSSTSGDYHVCMKICHGPGKNSTPLGQLSLDASTTAPEDRGWDVWDEFLLVPLALVTVDGGVITRLVRYHFSGDIYRQIEYPGTVKLFWGAGYGYDNAGVFTGYINLPPGWRPADGSASPSVPNFTGRFPIQINPADSTTPLNAMDATGGAATHTHTISLQADYGNAVAGSQVPTNTTAAASSYPPYVVSLYIVKI